MEGNTALGESLYMYLGVQAQWELMGSLQDAGGQSPAVNIEDPTLHWFGAGARLGFAYLF